MASAGTIKIIRAGPRMGRPARDLSATVACSQRQGTFTPERGDASNIRPCSRSGLSSGLRGPGHLQMPKASDADHAGGGEDHAGQEEGGLEAAKE
jgi:hypothetical protein